MTTSRKNDRRRPDEKERRYEEVRELLTFGLTGMYGMSAESAEELVKEAYRTHLVARGAEDEAEKWVIGAAMKHAETEQRMQRAPSPEDAASRIARQHGLVVTAEVAEALPEPLRTAVRMRFLEGKTYAQLAEALDVKSRHAEQLVVRGVVRLCARRR